MKLGLWESMAVYIPAAILMYCMTKFLIPYLVETTGQETILLYFIVASIGIFIPLILTGILMLKAEGYRNTKATWIERIRFRKITKNDLIWSVAGIILIGVFSMILIKGLEFFAGKFDHSPTFMTFDTLSKGRYWLLLVWIPYWILNILGEEFIWRGVMLPRQEIAFGKYTWAFHGFGWALFHIAFGWQLLITMIPLLFIQSFIVQRTKNTWVGVIIHGGLNGPGFLAISFGLL